MKNILQYFVLAIFISSVLGPQVHAVPYDYSYTHECLAKPLRPQYGGGIIMNPELNQELKGWAPFGDAAAISLQQSIDGNKYIVASNRTESFHSFSQKFNLERGKHYTISAWLQVSHGEADVAVVFKTRTGFEKAGWVTARKGCWSMLKGGISVDVSGPAELYFESSTTGIEIWGDSISLQPFSDEEWIFHQNQNIDKFRKQKVRIQALDEQGRPIPNAPVTVTQTRPNFPLGCAINKNILSNTAYQNWFTSRFKYTVFENELKWYSTEGSRGFENYMDPDALVQFAKSHGVMIRGHNVFWDDPKFQPSWVGGLSTNDLWAAANKRINSVVSRYRGQFIHWDVVNENLHFSFFESKLGPTASAVFYGDSNRIDGRATPFLNEYNTIEESRDAASSPFKYLQKIKQLRSQGYNGPLGIGLEGHFSYANLAYIRSALDTISAARLPIWVTELDVSSGPNQASYLDSILRELIAYRGIQGVLIWSAWSPQGCYRMCLTDNNFRNLATGDVVDRISSQLTQEDGIKGTTDANGLFETSVYHGDYEAVINYANGTKLQRFSVLPNEASKEAKEPVQVVFKIDSTLIDWRLT